MSLLCDARRDKPMFPYLLLISLASCYTSSPLVDYSSICLKPNKLKHWSHRYCSVNSTYTVINLTIKLRAVAFSSSLSSIIQSTSFYPRFWPIKLPLSYISCQLHKHWSIAKIINTILFHTINIFLAKV